MRQLHAVAKNRDVAGVRAMLRFANMDLNRAYRNEKPLIAALPASGSLNWAEEYEQAQIVEKLIRAKADVNDGSAGYFPLHAARSVDAVRALVVAKANVNALDKCGRTPVFAATLNTRPHIVDELLHLRADPGIADRDGKELLELPFASFAREGESDANHELAWARCQRKLRSRVSKTIFAALCDARLLTKDTTGIVGEYIVRLSSQHANSRQREFYRRYVNSRSSPP